MNKMDERIMVVNVGTLFDGEALTFQGLNTDKKVVNKILHNCNKYFEARRGLAENFDLWKQPIPYAVITRGDEVFIYERLKGGGEKRLHNKLSIGVGGHMNRVNDIRDFQSNLDFNIFRELAEEVSIRDTLPLEHEVIGLINDDSTEVNRVHLGILVEIKLSEESQVDVREKDVLDGYWIRKQDLIKDPLFDRLEDWSQIVAKWMV